ncbi:hypothetical protein G6F42_014808 [Rhizopus arrhizus]|nr:hypothetical protein G6F42_014808 [Rhizopus arrhizus]
MITQKSVYNAKLVELNGLTPIQFLIEQLDEKTYKLETVVNADNGRIECLFIPRKDLLSVYNRYHTSLVMDATYKTNRFGLPLVQVCGITNENKTFVLCQAFLRNETEGIYEWFINQMKKHCFSEHVPVSISMGRDFSLLNALKTELPEAKHLLCRWHISKKVLSHIPKVFNGLEKDSVETILVNWNHMVSSHTQQDYASNLAALITNLPKKNNQGTVYGPSLFEKYLRSTWLNGHKEKFVSAWTDMFTHPGTTFPSRIEGAHAVLKRHLTSSTGDLSTVFDKMDAGL